MKTGLLKLHFLIDFLIIPQIYSKKYLGYRNGPNEHEPYGLSSQYWHVFAARLAFVVIFEVKFIYLECFFKTKYLKFLAHCFRTNWNYAICYTRRSIGGKRDAVY